MDTDFNTKYTQEQRVIMYLTEHPIMTPMDAWNELGITKLATVVSRLKRKGYAFRQQRLTSNNRFGEKCSFMSYALVKDDELV